MWRNHWTPHADEYPVIHANTPVSLVQVVGFGGMGKSLPAGARDLQEQVLAVIRRILGEEHPETTVSAWTLFVFLMASQERDAADEVSRNHLTWLIQAEPHRLAGDQSWIRQELMEMLEKTS